MVAVQQTPVSLDRQIIPSPERRLHGFAELARRRSTKIVRSEIDGPSNPVRLSILVCLRTRDWPAPSGDVRVFAACDFEII